MAKRLSLRPLKRDRRFEIELNPGGHYILWISEVPKGKRRHRFMSVVQKMTRSGEQYSDEIHNPILFRKVVVLPNSPDSELVAKYCYRKAQKAMYWLLEGALRQCGTRCRLRLRGSTTDDWPPEEWETLPPPVNGEEGLPEWRLAARDLAAHHIGYWNQPPEQ